MSYINSTQKIKLYDYQKEIFDFVLNNQLLSSDLWSLLVNQYRIKSDTDSGWRGEFFGKLLRGAVTCYKVSKNLKLYNVITNAVKDIVSIKDKTLSSYEEKDQLTHWDVWGRKYLFLGLIFYYDICKNVTLKERVLKFVENQADSLIKQLHKNHKTILDCSTEYGAMNSCSILISYVKLYEISKEDRFLEFAKTIVDSGLCKDFNLITSALDKDLYPYQFKQQKAYEMISCYEGLLEYYKVNKNPLYLNAVKSFFDKVIKTDYTIIGCCGCSSEFFDNSTLHQTEELKDIAQETCVTVNLISLCASLFEIEHDEKYINYLERSTYNALYGAVNNEKQTMQDAKGLVWLAGGPILAKHGAYTFDSYSPLVNCSRGKQVAGFMRMQDDKSFGCCAAIGAYGVGLANLITLTKEDNSYFVNIYQKSLIKINDELTFKINGSVYKGNNAKISIQGKGHFTLKLRIPFWSKTFKIKINSQEHPYKVEKGYAIIEKDWENDVIDIKLSSRIKAVFINDKVSFIKGNIVYARDERFSDFNLPVVFDTFKHHPKINIKKAHCIDFKCNAAYIVNTSKSTFHVCDYSQAGKQFDSKPNLVNVWHKYIN